MGKSRAFGPQKAQVIASDALFQIPMEVAFVFDKSRAFLKKLGLPEGDLWDLPTSGKKFPDGADFRMETPTINSAKAMFGLLDEATKNGDVLNRVTETLGIVRHTVKEIREYVKLGHEYGCELNLSVGPRAVYDTSATVNTSQGVRISYRLRGMEQVVRAIEDVKRAVDLGVRGILVYDEGLLYVLNEMRKAGELPADVKFKVSAHCGHCNSASFRVLESLGADTINPVRDLQLPMVAGLRASCKLPIDLHTDNPPASGGFIRTYEAPEMVRIVAPVYLKTGNSVISAHGMITSEEDGRNMARQVNIVLETVHRYLPNAVQTKKGDKSLAIPG